MAGPGRSVEVAKRALGQVPARGLGSTQCLPHFSPSAFQVDRDLRANPVLSSFAVPSVNSGHRLFIQDEIGTDNFGCRDNQSQADRQHHSFQAVLVVREDVAHCVEHPALLSIAQCILSRPSSCGPPSGWFGAF